MSWFPLNEQLMEGSPEFRALSPAEKIYTFFLISEFNWRGTSFYKSDLELAVTLGVSEKTIRRARAKLIKLGWIKTKPGSNTRRGQCLATTYFWFKWVTVPPKNFFAQMPRYTFNVMLDRLRESRLQAGDIVVYVSLFYWFWRNQGKYEDRDRFFITKKELQSLTNLRDTSTRVPRIYEAIVFSNGEHLFEYQEEYHRIIFKDWSWCADPDKDEENRRNEEIYIRRINDLVARKKQDRQIKIQQKIVQTSQPPFTFFLELYKKIYGRLPHYNWGIKERFLDIEKTHGYAAIYRAINWYFSAEMVPNGTGAQTRTIKNFIIYINDILELSDKYAFV